MRVVLHIGSTKTGSSALQATLFARREELVAAGALYSASGVAAGAHHLLLAAIHPGAWRMHLADLPADREAYFRATAAAIRAEADAAGVGTILLSSEYLWGSQPLNVYERFRAAFPGATFEVAAFVRRADEWAGSSYLQAVKSGETRDFGDYMRQVLFKPNSGLHAFRVVNRWAHMLDAATSVIRYEAVKANVFAAYCAAVGLDVDTAVEMARVNPSPTAEGTAELLQVNRSDAPEDEKKKRRREIMRTHRAHHGTNSVMSAAERAELLTVSAKSDRLLAARFPSAAAPAAAVEAAPPRPAPEPVPALPESGR